MYDSKLVLFSGLYLNAEEENEYQEGEPQQVCSV